MTKEVIQKYIDGYFSKKCRIVKSKQPHFWEAVIMLCSNPDADISHLIIEGNNYCIDGGSRLIHYSDVDENAESVSGMAVNIAKIIRESEQRNFSNVDIFFMQKDIESLKAEVRNINGRNRRIM